MDACIKEKDMCGPSINAIAIENKDGSVRSICCANGVKRTLKAHYKTDEKVNALLDIGWIKKLSKTIEGSVENRVIDNPMAVSETYSNVEIWKMKECYCHDFMYLFKDGKWNIFKCNHVDDYVELIGNL